MTDFLEFTQSLQQPLLSTALLLSIVLLVHVALTRYIRTHVAAHDLRRRWLVQSRNALALVVLLGLVIVWATELRTLAISLVALAVAFVVATKELILCLSGSLLKATSRSFELGDRIQIKDFRGDVIDQNLLSTTILEVGPGKLTHSRTGRMAVIPNSLFVSEPVINESYTDDFILHVFTVPFKREDDWQGAREALLDSAQRHCAPYLEAVRRHMERLGERRGLDVPSVDPRVMLQVPTATEVHLVIRVPAKSGERGYIEQAILWDVFGSESPALA